MGTTAVETSLTFSHYPQGHRNRPEPRRAARVRLGGHRQFELLVRDSTRGAWNFHSSDAKQSCDTPGQSRLQLTRSDKSLLAEMGRQSPRLGGSEQEETEAISDVTRTNGFHQGGGTVFCPTYNPLYGQGYSQPLVVDAVFVCMYRAH